MADNEHPHFETPPHERTWIDNPKKVEFIVYTLYAICTALVIVDIWVPKHGPFAVEHWFGFYAFYGFIACVGLVVAAKGLRTILMRSEDYYDE